MGGMSSEREVSLKTGAAVLASLQRLGLAAVGIDADRGLCEKLKQEKVDIAFIALHGKYGEDGCVQGALELMGIPYTGSAVAASAIAMSKTLTKIICRSVGVPTPGWRTLMKKDFTPQSLSGVTAPVVVKPANAGSSIAVTICMSDDQIAPAVDLAFGEDEEVLIEDFISGTLITIGVLGDMTLPAVEIEPEGGFYDYARKYTPGLTKYHVPARLPQNILDEAAAHVLAAHRALGCKGVSRSEVIVDAQGRTWFIELNTLPGMTETSLLPKEAAQMGISFDDLTLTILMEAVADAG